VSFGGESGPDLAQVAQASGRSEADVVEAVCASELRVFLIGFLPGFPYLGELPDWLHLPRRSHAAHDRPRQQPGHRRRPGRDLSLAESRRLAPAWPARRCACSTSATSPARHCWRPGDSVRFRAVESRRIRAASSCRRRRCGRQRLAGAMIEVVDCPLPATFQDAGRPGYRHLACRFRARSIPNGWRSPTPGRQPAALPWRWKCACSARSCVRGTPVTIALAGEFSARIEDATGQSRPAANWCSHTLAAGDLLQIGSLRSGIGYLAVRGGFDLPVVLGSRSTYARAGLGGIDGRALRAGDKVENRRSTGTSFGHRRRRAYPSTCPMHPFFASAGPLRVIPVRSATISPMPPGSSSSAPNSPSAAKPTAWGCASTARAWNTRAVPTSFRTASPRAPSRFRAMVAPSCCSPIARPSAATRKSPP
jgi:hypothetical protein